MADAFATFTNGLESPPTRAYAVVPNDANELPFVTRAINVGLSGDVAVVTADGDNAILHIVAGIAFPIRARRVLASGTTATGIVGLH